MNFDWAFNEEVKDFFLIIVMKTSISQSEKVDCSLCAKKVTINRMRQQRVAFVAL